MITHIHYPFALLQLYGTYRDSDQGVPFRTKLLFSLYIIGSPVIPGPANSSSPPIPPQQKGSLSTSGRTSGRTRAGTGCRSVASRSSGSRRDRKSTRLNSSHVRISYAVFCLQK